ncbi:MAG: replicative DNA helicase [Ruminococcus sp.]|nr:replicative DNA helicase [Ruminococcus sp.]MBQ8904872.1 replicative DNA helicase [Ruminococcus sp.]
METNSASMAAGELPYSLEAEQTILGAILIDSNVIATVIEKIRPECFFNEKHRALYGIMVQLFTTGSASDIIVVLNEAVTEKVFESAQEGRTYLASLVNMVPSVANIESYCNIVAEKYYIRSLATAAREVLDNIAHGAADAQVLLDSAEQRILEIRQGKDVRGLIPIREAVVEAYDHIGRVAGPDREKYIGARTGYGMLDAMISGLNKSDLILLAARPAMGKTAFALNIATNVARRSGKDVAIFSLEMSMEQLATRMLSTEALVDSNKIRSGKLETDDWVRLASSANYLSGLGIYMDESTGVTAQQIKAKLRRMKNIGLVVIDYLQLMDSTSKSENRAVVVADITRQLKIMAKELEIPVILLSQLNRGVESRPDKRPLMSDLRESGSIEQDADIVMFLYRDYYYNKECDRPNICECIVAKNRHGETGKVELIWDGQFTRFSNPEYSQAP